MRGRNEGTLDLRRPPPQPHCRRPPAQAEPETKALLRQRSKIERKIDHLQDLGMRTARYRGRRKTRLQALLAANFKRLGVLGAFDVPAIAAVAL